MKKFDATLLKRYLHIEEEFFDLDQENKIAKMHLHFASPSEIFDSNAITKAPVLSDDFIEWIKAAFEYTPIGYHIDLDISFDDLEGYQEDELEEIFIKNVLLEDKRASRYTIDKSVLALILIGIGLVSLVSMILFESLWTDGGVAKTILSYIFDIATTVTFWEAMTILLVENRERRTYRNNLKRRFASITFKRAEIGAE